MRITQTEINRYRNQIKGRENDAKAYLIARMQREAAGLDVADARNATIEIMRDCLAVFGDQAQEISASFFDEMVEAGEFEASAAEMFDDIINDEMMQEKVRYYAGKLKDGDWDGYAGSNADLAAFYVHRSAFQNMERNCYKNGIRYARVGTGRETCGFCFMLSTRGFDYRSEDTASAASHVHCDCVIVPGEKGKTKIAGYEPEKMYARWKSCQETLGGDDGLRERFQALSEKELGKVKGRNIGEKWLKWRNTQVYKEVETRDNEWLYRGKASQVDNSLIPVSLLNADQKHAFEKDGNAAQQLALNGIPVKMIDNPKEKTKRGIKKFDYQINSDYWEAKCPEGDGYLAVAGNIAKSDNKFRSAGYKSNTVLSNADSKMSDDQFLSFFKEWEKDPESDLTNIKQIILVLKDGSIRRYIKSG